MSTSRENKKDSMSCFCGERNSSIPLESVLSLDFEWTDEAFVFYESAFLHDLLNSAGGLRGYLELLDEVDDLVCMKKYVLNSLTLCDSLISEVEYHRQFMHAKNGDFKPVLAETTTTEILQLTVLTLSNHVVSKYRKIEIAKDCFEKIETDIVLLSRLLVNMTKNAIEATESGGTVLICAEKINDVIRFSVHNSSVISEAMKQQIFKTKFSTKGNNRGIGLFSIQLLSEKLGGTVGFESNSEIGTCFFIDLPLLSAD